MAENNQQQNSAPNFDQLEKEVLKFWQEDGAFEKTLAQTKDGEPYIFYDGPPFATGLPHYGSILPSVIKDTIPRYQTMKGRYVRRRWGWDCHGLPIENIVEQKLKISGKKQIEELGVDKFNQACRENVLRFTEEWGKTIARVARWVDFENSYKTMDTSYQESVWWGLQQIWNKGLIYEDRKVLLYCSRCETPISNFEVAMDNSYRDITEESVYAKFKLPKGQRIGNDLTGEKTYALAWTTTPWTLPGNTALNVGPDIKYVLVEQDGGERYILAKERLGILSGPYEVVAEFLGRALDGLEYEPLYEGVIPDGRRPAPADYPRLAGGEFARAHKIYLADFVTTTDGTGVVHNAAMYGEEDYDLAKAKDLPRVDMLDQKGQYLGIAPEHLRGVFFKDADKIILAELRQQGKVYKTEHYRHSYPHCYRCGTPLFYNALPAWFINIQQIKPQLLANNESVNWYPEHLKNGRFRQGLENAPDWNISRNRYWATALPFWKCGNPACGHAACIGSVGELLSRAVNFAEVYPDFHAPAGGPDAAIPKEELDKLDLHKPYIDRIVLKCERCGADMARVPEVVDCWVESGSMPFAELHYPFENRELFERRFPSDFVVEYIPQTRAWFYVMHAVSTILFGRAPFRNVMTTGTILAEDGTKMSKSKNNYPDPNLVIGKYGADALRFYLLASPVVAGEDLNFSEKGVAEILRKVNMLLYNVWSFYRMYEKGRASKVRPAPDGALDQWMLQRLDETALAVTAQLDAYNPARACKALTDLINDLSTWYLRRSRDRIKDGDAAALGVLGFVLAEICKLLAPFMPFLSDFLFRDLTGLESVHLESWPAAAEPDRAVLDKMEAVRQAVSAGLAARKAKSLAVRQPLAAAAVELADAAVQLEPEYARLLLEELNVKKLDQNLLDSDLRPAGTVEFIATGLIKRFCLDVNLTPELKREGMARELERTVQDLRKKSGLKVGELADVYYNIQDEALESALLGLLDRKKTFVSQISKSLEVEVDFETQIQIDGKAVWLGIVRI
ncbi:MAG TPA: isoleucine--tRNA ligase [Patescibacteria group bacterium]|nr:isoleucine--tRNA ligase [Patescibacteria group bacterium]